MQGRGEGGGRGGEGRGEEGMREGRERGNGKEREGESERSDYRIFQTSRGTICKTIRVISLLYGAK